MIIIDYLSDKELVYFRNGCRKEHEGTENNKETI
jgi:hypothetical protein